MFYFDYPLTHERGIYTPKVESHVGYLSGLRITLPLCLEHHSALSEGNNGNSGVPEFPEGVGKALATDVSTTGWRRSLAMGRTPQVIPHSSALTAE